MTLVIMAAGMGSRFGGLKQIEPVDSSGHILIDYSVYDAIRAGFDRVVFIIKRDNEGAFRKIIDSRIPKWKIEIDYAYQEVYDLPQGIACPDNRKKPWGTGQAVTSLLGVVSEPFALINADDYYGPQAFYSVRSFLSGIRAGNRELCMIGYRLENTLSKNGAVSRGVCRVNDGFLTEINEIKGIRAEEDRIFSDVGELCPDRTVSMNFWGLTPEIIDECVRGFVEFLREKSQKELNVCEFYLPSLVSRLINEGKYKVKVIESYDRWYGITYRDDRTHLSRALDEMTLSGAYPTDI